MVAKPASTFVFQCPNCGDPFASTEDSDVVMDSGAVYTCDECNGQVIFVPMPPDDYCEWANWKASNDCP